MGEMDPERQIKVRDRLRTRGASWRKGHFSWVLHMNLPGTEKGTSMCTGAEAEKGLLPGLMGLE